MASIRRDDHEAKLLFHLTTVFQHDHLSHKHQGYIRDGFFEKGFKIPVAKDQIARRNSGEANSVELDLLVSCRRGKSLDSAKCHVKRQQWISGATCLRQMAVSRVLALVSEIC